MRRTLTRTEVPVAESRGAPSPLAISVIGKLATPFLPFSDDKEGASVGTLKIFLTTSVKIPLAPGASHRQHAPSFVYLSADKLQLPQSSCGLICMGRLHL